MIDECIRITDEERQDFHDLLDVAINKLESEKNRKKCHWYDLDLPMLRDMILIESMELNYAVNHGLAVDINTECDDIINIAMFIKHNLYRK